MKKRMKMAAVVLSVVCAASLWGCQAKQEATTPSPSPTASPTETEEAPEGAEAEKELPLTAPLAYGEIDLPQLTEPVAGETIAKLHTNFGVITLRFFPEDAPKAVENFLTHAKDGYYDGVLFHRVAKDFVIQGGDPNGDGTGGESIFGAVFENETTPKLHHLRGALAMANSGPNTNGSQFYIVQNNDVGETMRIDLEEMQKTIDQVIAEDEEGKFVTVGDVYPEKIIKSFLDNGGTPALDYRYTVFGQVIDGMDVVDAIAAVEITPSNPDAPNDGKPVQDVVIEKVEVTTFEK